MPRPSAAMALEQAVALLMYARLTSWHVPDVICARGVSMRGASAQCRAWEEFGRRMKYMLRSLTSANSASAASSAVVSPGAYSARTARSLPPRVPPAEEGSIASESLDSPRDASRCLLDLGCRCIGSRSPGDCDLPSNETLEQKRESCSKTKW